MNNSTENINFENEKSKNIFFEKSEITWKKTKEEVWQEISQKIENGNVTPTKKAKSLHLNFASFSIAAAILILVSIGGFMKFYTQSFHSKAGEHLTVTLPDGSLAHLNALSSIEYQPYWWWRNRNVTFEGEAFFEVEKGKKFSVNSINGTTTVLGTSFNIFSRNNYYRVSCLTGKVKITTPKNISETIVAGQNIEIDNKGVCIINETENVENAVLWTKNSFFFTATPLIEVFAEIERQYNIKIVVNEKLTSLYSGNFAKAEDVEVTLSLICKPFGLAYKMTEPQKYLIYRIE